MFLHAGPGLNAEAERQTLAPLLEAHQIKVSFPDEPSSLRANGPIFTAENALQNLIKSTENELLKSASPVTLIGLSFGALIAEHFLQKFPNRVRELILISPTPNLHSVFLKMIEIAESDLKTENPPLALELVDHKAQIQSFFDPPTQLALSYTLRDPKFFGHYWFNSTAMAAWGKTLSCPEFAFDSLSQKCVYDDLRDHPQALTPVRQSDVPVTLVFGQHDPVLDLLAIRKYYQEKFTHFREVEFQNSAHFPHLEESAKFVDLLKMKRN